ncbi:hypothetical protein JW898_06110 [Candidatus Woesearchaeota archaeon]|nr:hypothetical protein [Candidatus Woesearchaeota archaeon]
MKKAIAFFLVLVLLLTLGCAGKQAQKTGPASEAATAEAADTTSAAVSDVDSDLGSIDDLDEEFTSGLDSLDTELNFEI